MERGCARRGSLCGVYVLGAPDLLRPTLNADAAWPAMEARAHTLSALGKRVLLVAWAPDARLDTPHDRPLLPANLTPLGLVSLVDELRPEAATTLAAF